MAYMPTVHVFIDDTEYEVQLAQGDYVRAEADGHRFGEEHDAGTPGFASVTWHALNRAKRKGLIAEDADIPASFEDFLDIFSWPAEPAEETDPKDSSQGQATS